MAWDKRGYFYRSRRVGRRVVRDYYGKGPIAEMAAFLMSELRRAREARGQGAAGADAQFDREVAADLRATLTAAMAPAPEEVPPHRPPPRAGAAARKPEARPPS